MYCFLHIRKTGGTSFRWSLESKFSVRHILRCYRVHNCSWVDIPGVIASHSHPFHLVITMDGYIVDTVLPEPVSYLTLLRNPLKRSVSHFYHHYTDRSPYQDLHQVYSFDDYIRKLRILQLDNVMVRSIAGVMGTETVTEDHLDRARRHLHDFSFVGITEHFEQSLALLARKIGWKKVTYVYRNPTPDRQKPEIPTDGQLTQLTELNHLDQQLYDTALTLFDREIRAQQIDDTAVQQMVQKSFIPRLQIILSRSTRMFARRLYRIP